MEVSAGIDFAHEKKLFFTSFAQCKPRLWKSCELDLAQSVCLSAEMLIRIDRKAQCQVLENKRFVCRKMHYCSGCLSERRPGWVSAFGCLGIAIVPVLATLLIP
jgi:hypothetical protein